MEIKKKIEEPLLEILNEKVWNISNLYKALEDLIIKTSTEMCELQKQECAYEAKLKSERYHLGGYAEVDYVYEENGNKAFISKDSILNCKNVCTT